LVGSPAGSADRGCPVSVSMIDGACIRSHATLVGRLQSLVGVSRTQRSPMTMLFDRTSLPGVDENEVITNTGIALRSRG